MDNISTWLLRSEEPWTRYRTRSDLIGSGLDDHDVMKDRQEMLNHPLVSTLIMDASTWPGDAIRRHNDAKHPLYKLVVLADFGLCWDDFESGQIIDRIHEHQSPDGAFCSLLNIPAAFGGSGQDSWSWVACDAPVLLYTLLALGSGVDGLTQRALDHLLGLAGERGWSCSSDGVSRFHGPGKRGDPCPMANLLALKAISCVPDLLDCVQARQGVEMLLRHWEERREKKYFLFAMGTDFCKVKYPFIWYDILHVLDVLHRFSFAHSDPRFQEMLAELRAKMDMNGRFTAESMYLSWKGWSFADKKNPSEWLTLLAYRSLRFSADSMRLF